MSAPQVWVSRTGRDAATEASKKPRSGESEAVRQHITQTKRYMTSSMTSCVTHTPAVGPTFVALAGHVEKQSLRMSDCPCPYPPVLVAVPSRRNRASTRSMGSMRPKTTQEGLLREYIQP